MSKAIVEERHATHGDFFDNAVAYDPENPLRFPADMIRVKLIRACQGDPMHEDHWRDIAGYAEIALGILRRLRDESQEGNEDGEA